MAGPSLTDFMNPGRDLNLAAGDTAAGGSQSFGNFMSGGGRTSARDSGWLFAASQNNTPMYIGAGLVALLIVGAVVLKAVK